MKVSHIPTLVQAIAAVKTVIVRSRSDITPLEMRLLEGYNQLRTDYVIQENWPIDASGIDVDTYDVAANSVYVIARVGERVVAGLRATPVSSVFGSMSYGMWQFAIESDSFSSQVDAHADVIDDANSTELWDITRLIAETSVLGDHGRSSKAYSRVGLLKVMAATLSGVDSGNDVAWVFTTTQRMLRFMEKSNIQVHVIAEARVSLIDEHPSAFCIAYPKEIFRALRASDPVTYRIAKRAIDSHGGVQL